MKCDVCGKSFSEQEIMCLNLCEPVHGDPYKYIKVDFCTCTECLSKRVARLSPQEKVGLLRVLQDEAVGIIEGFKLN